MGNSFPTSNSSICVVTSNLEAYSETFIRAHIEHLPGEIHVLSGGNCPTHADGEPLVYDFNLLQRIRFRFGQQSKGLPWNGEAKHFAAIGRFLHEHHVRAVLAEYGPTGVAMMDVCTKAGIPLIVNFHGYDAYKSEVLAHYQQQYPELFASAASVVAVSQDMYRQLQTLGAPEEKLCYNPCGADTSLFVGANPAHADPVFLAVGRFVDKKGPLLTLLAFNQVLAEVPEARLVMIGDGPLLDASRQLARASKITHTVEFRGVQSHSSVIAAMQQARAFVQHSLRPGDGDSEGTPVAVLEASTSGLPVVSTRHGGIPDVVIDGDTGLLVDELDVDGMAQAMIRLVRDPELAARMGQAGRKRIEEHFSMQRSIANLWRIIESAIESRNSAAR